MILPIIKVLKIIGISGALIAYPFIIISIIFSPWFNFYNNALSDLGNAVHGSTALFYNIGLILSGFFTAAAAISISINHRSWKYWIWAIPLILAGLDLSLIGFFPENAGNIHLIVSVIFFVSIALTMLIYSYISWPLSTPALGGLSLIFGIVSIVIWVVNMPWKGVAIQETLTSAMAAIWLILVYWKNIQ